MVERCPYCNSTNITIFYDYEYERDYCICRNCNECWFETHYEEKAISLISELLI